MKKINLEKFAKNKKNMEQILTEKNLNDVKGGGIKITGGSGRIGIAVTF